MLFFLLFICLNIFFYYKIKSLSIAYIYSMITNSLSVFVVTELLSLVNGLNTWSLSLFYIFSILFFCYYFYSNRINIYSYFYCIKELFFTNKWLLFLLIIIVPLFILALFVKPNNWDSMTYHLPRIMHWIQNGNVDYFPTQNIRQIFHQPLAEYCLLHIRLLSWDDSLLNMLQFLFFIGLSMVVYQIVWDKLKTKSHIFLVLTLVFTTPIFVFEATTTQNDLVAGFFFITLIYFLNKFDFKKHNGIYLVSISLALAFLTKASMLIFAFPFLIEFAYRSYLNYKFQLISKFGLAILMCILFVLPYFYRNYSLTNHLMGDPEIEQLMKNDHLTISNGVVNAIRNIAMNCSLPIESYNSKIDIVVQKCQLVFAGKIDKKENTFGPRFRSLFQMQEDVIPQTLLLYLFFCAILIFLIKKELRITKNVIFLANIGISFFVFSFIFKWQPWGVRLLVPIYLLMIIFCFNIFQSLKSKWLMILSIFLVVSSLTYVFLNENKSINNPSLKNGNHFEGYFLFSNRIKAFSEQEFVPIKNLLMKHKVEKVGLDLTNDSWEYPLWAFEDVNRFHFYYINYKAYLNKLSKNKRRANFDAIISNSERNDHYFDKDQIKDSLKTKLYKLYIFK